MGGCGSGHWMRWDSKPTIESMHEVHILWMKKQGSLSPGATGRLTWSSRGEQTGSINYRMRSNSLRLSYRSRKRGGVWQDIEDEIFISWTPCNYGGQRPWFVCPSCLKRVVAVYGGKYFRCRHCHNLTYASQQESEQDRLLRKARKIREQLGASLNLFEPVMFKPKNMHQKTFDRLRKEADAAIALSWEIAAPKLGIRVEDIW